MCGIRLVVTRRYHRQQQQQQQEGSSAAAEELNAAGTTTAVVNKPSDMMKIPNWLKRRGPDSIHQQQQVVYQENYSTVVGLQASVLQMRQELVPQPVQIKCVVRHPTTTTTTTTATPAKTDKAEEPRIYHLAWNGEIYQRQSQLSHPGDDDDKEELVSLEDTWSYEMSDTRLVAEMIQKECQYGCHDDDDDDDDKDLLERLTKRVFSKMVNAEYAFCLSTDTAVYYGRDGLGRRSLLLWQPSTTAATTGDASSSNSASSMGATKVLWELASVATTNKATTAETWDGNWTEVEPGCVYCYNFVDGSMRSCPLKVPAVPLLQNPSTLPSSIQEASEQLRHLLFQAVQRRVVLAETTTAPCAILFSGGVDSVVLAALVCEVLPPDASIELINVSFVDQYEQQTDQQTTTTNTTTTTTLAADTLAAVASWHELKQLYPQHVNLRLVQQQADWIEIAAVESHVRDLLYPKETLMDVNIATALWFAAKACPGKLLLSGLGADEQMGGYGRHRKAWEWNMLREELDLDIQRLWDRNLGRDDRVLSDHGHEARYPYLDVNVMDYLARLPLELVVDFSLPPGRGDKRILRLVAEQMGLKIASVAVKRAIQFGSRISHVSDKRRFGSRRKASGTKHCTQGL